MSDDGEWNESEKRALASLPRETEPPPGLESRVVEALRAEGRLGPSRRRRPMIRAAVAAAAAILLFGAGWTASRLRAARPAGPRFALLLYEGKDFEGAGGHAEEYSRWAASLRGAGIAISGEKLADASRVVSRAPRELAPEPGILAGFFIVQAPDLGAAVGIARDCPHVRHGGWVAVRPIAGT